MRARQTIERFRSLFADLPIAEKQALLAFHAGLGVLADCADFAELANGRRLRDGLDFTAWLRELEAVTAHVIAPPKLEKVCHSCGHAHKDKECGMEMGGERVCKCDVEVGA